MSYAVWTMVQIRKIRQGEEFDEADQTEEVIQSVENKSVPVIQDLANQPDPIQTAPTPVVQQQIATGPPLPPTGLPEGWTMEQWNAYGHQYLEMQAK